MSYIYHGKKGWIKQPNRNFKTWESGLCMIQEQYICAADSVDYSAFRQGDPMEDSEPCLDGAFIYPDPVYETLGNGFVQATITAYGRTNTTGSRTSIATSFKYPVYAQLGQFSCTGQNCDFFFFQGEATYLPMAYIDIVVPLPTIKIVLPETQFPKINSFASNIPIYGTDGKDITNQLYYVYNFLNGNYAVGTNNPPIRFTESDYHSYPVNIFGNLVDQIGIPAQPPGFLGRPIILDITASNINSTNYGKFTEYIIPINNVKINQLTSGLINFGAFYEKAAPTIIDYGATIGPIVVTIRLETLIEQNLNAATRLEIEVNGSTYSILGGIGNIVISLAAGVYPVKYRAYNDYGMTEIEDEITVP